MVSSYNKTLAAERRIVCNVKRRETGRAVRRPWHVSS